MQTKKYILAVASAILLSGCDEVDLINIEVKDDLSTNVQIVVSPPDPDPALAPNSDTNLEETKKRYFQETKEEFESCGFEARKNLGYDNSGVSGSKSFSSRIDLEQAFSCLSYVTSQNPPIKLSYPTKTENLFQTNYELQLGVQNPDVIFGYGLFTSIKPVKEIRITLPGKIVSASTKNESFNVLFNRTETVSGIITINMEEIKFTNTEDEKIKKLFEQLDIDTTGFDYKRLTSQNQNEVNQANQELALIFKDQTGIDILNDPDGLSKLSKYIKDRIPPYTTIVIGSSKSKIDVNLVVTVTLGVLPFFIGFLVFLYRRKKKTSP